MPTPEDNNEVIVMIKDVMILMLKQMEELTAATKALKLESENHRHDVDALKSQLDDLNARELVIAKREQELGVV